MKKVVLTALSTVLISAIAYAAPNTNPVKMVPEFKGGLSQTDVFSQGQAMLQYCMGNNSPQQNFKQCLNAYAKQHGATAKEIKFTDLVSGYIAKVQNVGDVSVVYAGVMGADHSDGYYIVTKKGGFINVDGFAVLKRIEAKIKANSQYAAIKQANPKSDLFPGNHTAPQIKQNANKGDSILFNYRILNGCMACAANGKATVAFDFNKQGEFTGVKVVSVTAKAG